MLGIRLPQKFIDKLYLNDKDELLIEYNYINNHITLTPLLKKDLQNILNY